MVSQLTSPLAATLAVSPLDRLRELPAHLGAQIKGQAHLLERVCSVLTRGELGFANPRRPKGSFLFVGPTGVGKTELTNVFTSYIFDGAAAVRFDMSEYQLQSSVEKLIGGSRDDSGLLGRALREATRGTLLFDEVEKAHPLVLDLFLQILEDGRVTLATGETLDLRAFYIVFTSNLGASEAMRMENAPFASIERTVVMRVRQALRPELVGRVTELVVFNRLDFVTQRAICEAMIAAERARMGKLGHALEIHPDAVEFLIRHGYHRTLGARPMRGAVERYVQEAVAKRLLAGQSGSGCLHRDSDADQLVLR
jgi:ATP-dependent Clp protease ATP-binding subunit ClpB